MSIDLVGFLLVKRGKFYTLKEDPDLYIYIYAYIYIYIFIMILLNTSPINGREIMSDCYVSFAISHGLGHG